MKNLVKIWMSIILVNAANLNSQTFFETASDDGVIQFSGNDMSQIKLNASSTNLTFGYYDRTGTMTDPVRRLFSIELKVKPNEDGIGAFAKSGDLQPGVKVNSSMGWRFLLGTGFNVLDIYFKPEYSVSAPTIFDSSRTALLKEAKYQRTCHSYGGNVLLNYGVSLGARGNLFLGLQGGVLASNNLDDLKKGSYYTAVYNHDSSLAPVMVDVKDVKVGKYEDVIKFPLKADVLIDPGLQIQPSAGTNVDLGFFIYVRTNAGADKARFGFGVCLLNNRNPSQVMTSIGYESPFEGGSVTGGKGIIFATAGITIP